MTIFFIFFAVIAISIIAMVFSGKARASGSSSNPNDSSSA